MSSEAARLERGRSRTWRATGFLLFAVTSATLSCSTGDPGIAPAPQVPKETTASVLQAGAFGQAAQSTEPQSKTSGFRPPWSWFNALRGDSYALDDIKRRVDPKARVQCDATEFETYKGTHVSYAGSVRVDPAFVARLARFEELVNEVALEVYGRKPAKLLHAGAYACRKSRNRTTRLSEHALGNALDVVGFTFNRATKEQQPTTPKLVRGAFRVTVGQHWSAERSEVGRLHRDFLRKLADRVVDSDVFRVALGPSHPGHKDHLHFDMSPWNYTHL